MRLISVEINGVRRLLSGKCHLGNKLTAIVGPNEAGKSTLLYCLLLMNNDDPVPVNDLSRVRRPRPGATVVATEWEIEDEDVQALKDHDVEEPPRRLRVEKSAAGARKTIVTPTPSRRGAPFRQVIAPLRRLQESAIGRGLARELNRDEPTGTAPFVGDVLDQLMVWLDAGDWEEWPDEDLHAIRELLAAVEGATTGENTVGGRAVSALRAFLAAASAGSPAAAIPDELLRLVPESVEFRAPDRDLVSSYDLANVDLSDPPPALGNLSALAGLNLRSLLSFINSGETGRVATILRDANARLEAFFAHAWTQSDLKPVLLRNGTVLDVLIDEQGGESYVVTQRSDGLRAFVALAAFLHNRKDERPVLLIDEAEVHLHYDAQRDLIDVLATQDAARQVVYTTHSPGCLPADLGTAVRAVIPTAGSAGVSEIHNKFWDSSSAGFSPLLVMMGASAAAFTATRSALLVEGPTEMILLPTLIRLANDLERLDYHVAPGLAVTDPEKYADFDLVASRRAYTVDGDAFGARIAAGLQESGVPPKSIVHLGGVGSGLTLEDLVTLDCFLEAVNAELRVTQQVDLQTLPDGPGRYNLLKQECQTRKMRPPSKMAIAGRLVWMAEGPTLSRHGKQALKQLHRRVMAIVARPS